MKLQIDVFTRPALIEAVKQLDAFEQEEGSFKKYLKNKHTFLQNECMHNFENEMTVLGLFKDIRTANDSEIEYNDKEKTVTIKEETPRAYKLSEYPTLDKIAQAYEGKMELFKAELDIGKEKFEKRHKEIWQNIYVDLVNSGNATSVEEASKGQYALKGMRFLVDKEVSLDGILGKLKEMLHI